MKELIPKDEYGVFADTNDTARVESLFVVGILRNAMTMCSGISKNY